MDADTGILPVEIAGTVVVAFVDEVLQLDAKVSADSVDIKLSDGQRILVKGPIALPGGLALVEGLMT